MDEVYPPFFRGVWVVWTRARVPASIHATYDPDQLSLDVDVVIELRRVLVIGGLKAHAVLFLVKPLKRDRVFFDLGDHDVAVMRGLLRADDNEVPVRDVRFNHGVA